MSYYMKMADALEQIGPTFSFGPFAEILQSLIEEVLVEEGVVKSRKGTQLRPKVLIWLILVLTIRRDLNYHQALNWMMSGFRWLEGLLPPQAKLVADGTISHARVKLGAEVFRCLFVKLRTSFKEIAPDFEGWVTVTFDGTTGTVPDSAANQKNSLSRPPVKGKQPFRNCGWSPC